MGPGARRVHGHAVCGVELRVLSRAKMDEVLSTMADVCTRPLRFASAGYPSYGLEGILTLSAESDQPSNRPGVVLCHPQPLTSSMDDTLVVRLSEELAAAEQSQRFGLSPRWTPRACA